MSIADNLEKLLATGNDNALLRFGLGSAYFNDKEFTKAIPHLESCITQDPEYTAAYKLLGKSLFKTGSNIESRKVFETGLPLAIKNGDKQTEKEILVFLQKLQD